MITANLNSYASFDHVYYLSKFDGELDPGLDKPACVDFYNFSKDNRLVAPNRAFDEVWYISHYADVKAAVEAEEMVSGYFHYCEIGCNELRFPNAFLYNLAQSNLGNHAERHDFVSGDGEIVRSAQAKFILNSFEWMTFEQYYNNIGRQCGDKIESELSLEALMMPYFDIEFYSKQASMSFKSLDEAFDHYLAYGSQVMASPSVRFDEKWYLSYYKDVREEVESGHLINGLHHYVLAGRAEQRMALYDQTKALEGSISGVTSPVLLNAVKDIRNKIYVKSPIVSGKYDRTFWMVCPRLNPDIVFGGYRAFFEMAKGLKAYLKDKNGIKLGFILTEELENISYFLYKNPTGSDHDLFKDVEIQSAIAIEPVNIGKRDRFLSYSSWDAWYAKDCASHTDCSKFFSFVQEYEAIFHPSGSMEALVNAAFCLDSYNIFNSSILVNYFKDRRIGLFSRNPEATFGEDYGCFEHVPTKLPVQTKKSISDREERWLVTYARPEGHAMRNMFEVMVIALQRACQMGVFDDKWNFLGLGALTDIPPVQLSDNHELVIMQRLPEDEYVKTMGEIDIGLSLMNAPHPSVVPFEFASTGAIVVTNFYEGRDQKLFNSISKNIIGCNPDIDGIVDALKKAVKRQSSADQRIRNRLKLKDASWTKTFSPEFFSQHFDWAM